MTDTERALAERAARRLGRRLTGWRRVSGGYTAATRLIVTCADGASAFVKGATDASTATWLRAEHSVYSHVHAAFLAMLLAWEDDGALPYLVLEDLSAGRWRVPWTAARVAQVLDTLQQVAGTASPSALGHLDDRWPRRSGWTRVAQESAPFLALGLCTPAWLEDSIGALVAAEAAAPLAGDALVHLDVRSDNMCFLHDRVVLVDWNWACRGNPAVDVAAWLPSLHLEGGPRPETILPNAPELAALMSGFFAARAGLPADDVQPSVRALQRAQLRIALSWASAALGLRTPDGGARPTSRAPR